MVALVVGTEGMRCVLHQGDASYESNLSDRFDINWGTCKVDRDNQTGSDGKASFYCIRGNHQRIPVNINEHRSGPSQYGEVYSGNPGHRRRDNFISGTDTKRCERQMHSRGR
jgi:hypothetical protein